MKRILIVKTGAIGDVVMALPLLTYFREKKAPIHITWVAGQIVKPLLEATQAVDLILTVDETALFKGSLFTKLKELLKIQAKLAGKSYDSIIIGHVDWRYKLLSLFARSKERRSFQRGNQRQNPVPGRYHADEYLRLATGIDDATAIKAELPNLFLPKTNHIDLNQSFIALAPGGARNTLAEDSLRRWPIQHYVELARKFEKAGIQVLLTGSETDGWILPYFEGLSCKTYVGNLSLLELISLYQNCRLLITHDSGSLHLAKLAGCPVLGLFGPTNPWEKVSRQDNIRILWGGERLACRPCYDGKTYAPCSENKCLKRILPDLVLQEALEMLKANFSDQPQQNIAPLQRLVRK